MHALAATLRTTVADIERGMSARELSHWMLWMHAEQVGPAWERARHAQIMAALYTGAAQKVGGGEWSPADFLPPDPWADASAKASIDDEVRVALLRAERDAMADAFLPEGAR